MGTREPEALLELGDTCEQRGCPSLAALVDRRILELEDSAPGAQAACEASFRLARILLKEGKPDYEQAFSLLRDATLDCPQHQEARKLLGSAQNDQTKEQVALVEKADKLYSEGNGEEAGSTEALRCYRLALNAYEDALALCPDEATGRAFVPKSTVLGKLARCRDRIDDWLYHGEFLPRERSVQPCSLCTKEDPSGFVTCSSCDGRKGHYRILVLGKKTDPTVGAVQDLRRARIARLRPLLRARSLVIWNHR